MNKKKKTENDNQKIIFWFVVVLRQEMTKKRMSTNKEKPEDGFLIYFAIERLTRQMKKFSEADTPTHIYTK